MEETVLRTVSNRDRFKTRNKTRRASQRLRNRYPRPGG